VWENRVNAFLPFSRSIGDFDFKQNHSLDPGKQLLVATPDIKWLEKQATEMLLLGSHGIIILSKRRLLADLD
jgi:methionyl aminopeptidase/protein phosphatase 2C family protein 2/3